MKIAFNDDALSLILEHLEKTHKELMRKAESWSYDLEGDYDNYLKARQDEMDLAAVINSMKKQRTFSQNNPQAAGNEPLADWEVELLTGKKPGGN